jgi:hypothetical protein
VWSCQCDCTQHDGNFGIFDFGPACCNHDYCWSSTRGKDACDTDFYNQLRAQCTPLLTSPYTQLTLPVNPGAALAPFAVCELMAGGFYLGVKIPVIVQRAFDDAQTAQKNHERSSAYTAQCPSTTVLSIDLLASSGTFPMSYSMFDIPDQLYIEYEGTRIFDTDDLVSGGASVNVSFSGSSTLISVTIFAPRDGTIWNVFIGCPA